MAASAIAANVEKFNCNGSGSRQYHYKSSTAELARPSHRRVLGHQAWTATQERPCLVPCQEKVLHNRHTIGAGTAHDCWHALKSCARHGNGLGIHPNYWGTLAC